MSENKELDKILEQAKQLEKFDFTKDLEFNHEEYYDVIAKIASQNALIKNQEAEVVIESQSSNYICEEFIAELNNKRNTIEDYIKKYDPNKDFLANMQEHDIDKLYAISNYLLNAYIQYVNEMEFNFNLTKDEIKFLNKILTSEIEYNGDEVFNYVQFMDTFWDKAYSEYELNKDKESITYKISIKSILILHHLIKNYTVKGKTNDFKLFRNVLYKIAQTNKLFNAYSIIIDRIKTTRELWGNGLEERFKELHPNIEDVTNVQ